jgi:hypothetical protein
MIYKDFIKNGYFISRKMISDSDISSIRNYLDLEFESVDNNALFLHQFKNEELIKKILSLYHHKILKEIKNDLEKISKKPIFIFPNFGVQKNYHVDLNQFHGWHRDCGGELNYEYCNKILSKENYFFSKIGFYLQNNTDYGGSIDIIKNSHKNFSKLKIIFRKLRGIPLKIITLLHKHLRKVYNFIPEKFFMSLINAKRLYPELGSAVIFDSRIVHRGSPISSKNLSQVSFKKGIYQADVPKNFTKYSIYCHFGSADGVDSYFYDRTKRTDAGSINELNTWTQQIKMISRYYPELSREINKVFEPLKLKYQKKN